jgi:hypothetical protein
LNFFLVNICTTFTLHVWKFTALCKICHNILSEHVLMIRMTPRRTFWTLFQSTPGMLNVLCCTDVSLHGGIGEVRSVSWKFLNQFWQHNLVA